jgi:hypothetical protein
MRLRLLGLTLICPMALAGCSTSRSATSDLQYLATAQYVPEPKAIGSMPDSSWCEAADLALSNPNISPAVRDEYIRTGQTSHCPHQLALPPPPAIPPKPLSQQEVCAQMLGALGNPYIDPALKQAALEKARNRGCLQ